MTVQREYGSFYNYILSFMPDEQPIINNYKTIKESSSASRESDAISRDMKKRGFIFFASTIIYANLQATGFVNDHLTADYM